MQKVYVGTQGCQMNEYDSQKMGDVLENTGEYQLTQDPELADILLLNTCSIREKAQEKVFHQIGRWKKLKNKKPNLIIGIGGCVASQEGEGIIKRTKLVDLVFGPQTIHRLPTMLAETKKTGKPIVDISFPEIEKFDHLPEAKADGVTAFVSIMEGCSKYCSYCVVPYTRGEEISRPLDDVLAEVVSLSEQGVVEINLLGQNVNDYQGPTHEGGTADLADLIHYVASIDKIKRIRFTTSHPNAFSDSLIEAYATEPKLVSHLHLPVQHGSDRILAAMKRGYTALEYKSKIRKLREARPDISISSDFIVGFPGETEQDFEAMMKLVRDVNFDFSFSFIYSRRPGTPAANLPDNVSLDIKKQRLAILQEQLTKQTDKIAQAMVGTIQPVLVLGLSRKSDTEYAGRTENNRMVHFKGNPRMVGKIIELKITEAKTNSLRAQVPVLEEIVA